MLWANNFTAMASKMTPKTFLMILMPLEPKKCSILEEVFSTTKITTTFIIMAIIIFSNAYSARNDNRVVKLPGPAIKGKAKGNTEAVMALFSSCYCGASLRKK